MAEKEAQEARAAPAAVPEQLSFKEKMKMFALESGEASTPKDKVPNQMYSLNPSQTNVLNEWYWYDTFITDIITAYALISRDMALHLHFFIVE